LPLGLRGAALSSAAWMAESAIAAGVTTIEFRTIGFSGGTSTSAGRWFLEPGQNQLNAQSAPANETMAITTPMVIFPHGKCIPAFLRIEAGVYLAIDRGASKAKPEGPMVNAAMKDE
jgi:hypothetical protein